MRMEGLHFLLFVSCLSVIHVAQGDIVELCSLIEKYTNRTCNRYLNYGCWCGHGHKGDETVDQADLCCKRHDDCYATLADDPNCHVLLPYFKHYNIDCPTNANVCRCKGQSKKAWDRRKTDGNIIAKSLKHGVISAQKYCSRELCQCDLDLAICLKTQSTTYRSKNLANCPDGPAGWQKF